MTQQNAYKLMAIVCTLAVITLGIDSALNQEYAITAWFGFLTCIGVYTIYKQWARNAL